MVLESKKQAKKIERGDPFVKNHGQKQARRINVRCCCCCNSTLSRYSKQRESIFCGRSSLPKGHFAASSSEHLFPVEQKAPNEDEDGKERAHRDLYAGRNIRDPLCDSLGGGGD